MDDGFVEQIRQFYEAHRRELYTYALLLTRRPAAAEDVVHTVFCNLLRRGRTPRALRPYAFRCIRNAALKELRRMDHALPDNSIFEPPPSAHDIELQARLEEALETLSPDERESIVLKTYSGMTLREIAAVRRVSINTAASWYRRGLAKLRVMMKEKPTDEGL